MSNLIAIFIGCGTGGLFRFWISNLIHYFLGRSFPFGTLTVNILGSFIMGLLFILLLERVGEFSQFLRALLLIGFLGGFTTFSSFSIETINLLQAGKISLALVNIITSALFCLLAAWIGVILGRQI